MLSRFVMSTPKPIAGPHQICGPNGFNCTTCHDPTPSGASGVAMAAPLLKLYLRPHASLSCRDAGRPNAGAKAGAGLVHRQRASRPL